MPPIVRRRFLKISLASLFASIGSVAYASNAETTNIEIVRLELKLPRLAPAFDGYRVVQISDIHMGTGMTGEQLHRIVNMVNAEQPDVIALTGDYVTFGNIQPLMQPLVSAFSQLKPKDITLATQGNHDYVTDPLMVSQMLRDSGVTELKNSVHTISRGSSVLHFAGVDTLWYNKADITQVLPLLPGNDCAVLLAHEPDFADISAATGRFDLQISGHSHGGQIRWPVVNRPVIVPRHGTKYPIGQYQVGSMIQYTNRGVGTSLPAIRLNCRPEITVYTLRSAT